MSKVTASIVVNFDASGGGSLAAEVDTRPDGYNAGRNTFAAGDQPVILVFASSDVSIDTVVASAGAVVEVAGGTIEVNEDLQFAGAAEASLNRPFYQSFTYSWLGTDLGLPTAQEGKVTVAAAGVAVLRVRYQALFRAYRVTGVPYPLKGETAFPVLVVVTGTKP